MAGLTDDLIVEYGISTDTSDLRVHVCPVVELLYFYQTQAMRREAWRFKDKPPVPAFQDCRCDKELGCRYCGGSGRVKSGYGYLLPVEWGVCFGLIRERSIDEEILRPLNFNVCDSLTLKGQKAVKVAFWLFSELRPFEIEDRDLQIAGYDMVLGNTGESVQVKCDYPGGPRHLGGTGNLFIQTHEFNPFNQI